MRGSRRVWLRILIVCLAGVVSMSAPVRAQSTVAVRVQWDPNPAVDGVSQYNLAVDGGTPVAVLASVCTATLCEQAMTVSPGNHTFSVSATNQWGTSAVTSVSVVTAPPGPPKNLRVVK